MDLSELIQFQFNKNRLESIKKNRKNIVPFVGAGISKGCGLFTWGELLHKLAVDYLTPDDISLLEIKGDFFDYADRIVAASGNADMIMKRVRELFYDAKVDNTEIPYLLVSMFSEMIITTNYDTLLEDASKKSPMGVLKPLLPCLEGQMNEAIQINARNLLKIHGSVEETQSFVFTREQYKKFYGERGNRTGKLIPAYLMKIFSGKKVLFVGCSLNKDYILDILEECNQQNCSLSHFAIVPFPSNHNDQIKRNRELARLGIEPIYYPEGDYQAVGKLINYLADENHFISSIRSILINVIDMTEGNKTQLPVFLSILKESYYKTTLRFPQLLDIDSLKEDFTEEILTYIGTARYQTDTLLNICKRAFYAYIKTGYLRYETEVVTYFSEQLENIALKENEIVEFVKKYWSMKRIILNTATDELKWAASLSDSEINSFAYDLLQKLQYKNGLNFAEIVPVYNMSKQLIKLVANRIDFNLRIRLMNSIGGFGHYFGDSEIAIAYLNKCISDIDSCGKTDRELMLFKAKCYANLAITKSLSEVNIIEVLEATEKDIFLKRKYGESKLLYSRSLNFYATVLKEVDPFKACDIYIEAAEIKKELIGIGKENGQEQEELKELVASWATTLFNIGLLAKDLELYDVSYKIICYANSYRFETVNACNRDYCSSINVCAELENFVHDKQNLKLLIDGIESRVDLPKGFAETLAHTWYVCAYYYYLKKEYSVAVKFIHKSIGASKKKGALVDYMQDIRTQILYGDIKSAEDCVEGRKVYIDVINSIQNTYGNDSYYLIMPYRHLLQTFKGEKTEYSKYYDKLYDRYSSAIRETEDKLKKYIDSCSI